MPLWSSSNQRLLHFANMPEGACFFNQPECMMQGRLGSMIAPSGPGWGAGSLSEVAGTNSRPNSDARSTRERLELFSRTLKAVRQTSAEPKAREQNGTLLAITQNTKACFSQLAQLTKTNNNTNGKRTDGLWRHLVLQPSHENELHTTFQRQLIHQLLTPARWR